jgi:hypothetical protein
LSCGVFHPDGMLYGSGTLDKIVRIWDMKSQKNVVNFEGKKQERTNEKKNTKNRRRITTNKEQQQTIKKKMNKTQN